MRADVHESSPFADPSPLYDDASRKLARDIAEMRLDGDEALHDSARVGSRLASLGLYSHLRRPDTRQLCVVREQLAYESPLADAVFAVQGLCMYPLLRADRKAELDAMERGEKIGGFGLTEPEAGSDVAAMRTTAKKVDGGWVLNGQKTLISNVGIAHHFVVFANANPEAGKKGISAFLVPADAHGVELARIELSGEHPLGRITLSDCRLPASALVGEEGQGLSLALGTLGVFRTTVGAAALGMAWRAFDESIAHVKRRVQFGKPLAELQLVQAKIADMATSLTAARFLVASAAFHNDAGAAPGGAPDAARRSENGRRASMAKMTATEHAQKIIDDAVQLHGGMGVALGSKVEELYREIRPLRIYEGATDVLKLIIAQSVLHRGA